MLLRRSTAPALSEGTKVRIHPALRAPHPAPVYTYTVSGETTPFTNVRPRCVEHRQGCPGPWYSLVDHHGNVFGSAWCGSELEAIQ